MDHSFKSRGRPAGELVLKQKQRLLNDQQITLPLVCYCAFCVLSHNEIQTCHSSSPGLFSAVASGLLWGPYAAGKDHPAVHILTHSKQRCKVNLQSFYPVLVTALLSTRACVHGVWYSCASMCCHSWVLHQRFLNYGEAALAHVTVKCSVLLSLLRKGFSDIFSSSIFLWKISENCFWGFEGQTSLYTDQA